MKIQVNLPETPRRRLVTVNIEVLETDEGPVIALSGLSGEEIDVFKIAKWFDFHDSLEDALTHECESCDQSHCDDGNCMRIDKGRVNDKIEELKHTFHELENLLD